jgi:predicted transcriptional regulator
MSNAAELLFELANSDRLTMLKEIDSEPLKLSQVARKLSTTAQETSRHLERLSKAKLIERDSTSAYRITSFGKLVLSLLPSLDFLQKRREFFLSHDLSSLPPGFAQRIGELSEHHYSDRLDEALAHAERIINEAKQYLWLMSDQQVRQSYPHEHPEPLSLRLILPTGIDLEAFQRIRKQAGSRLQIGFVDNVSATIVMNEKTAAICFPSLDGRMDFTQAFAGSTPKFHEWCRDLYSFYWDKSTKKNW